MIIYTVWNINFEDELFSLKRSREMFFLDLDPVGLAQELIQNVNWNVESVTSSLWATAKTGFCCISSYTTYSWKSRITTGLISFELNKINIQA